jgi:hypothetical protein
MSINKGWQDDLKSFKYAGRSIMGKSSNIDIVLIQEGERLKESLNFLKSGSHYLLVDNFCDEIGSRKGFANVNFYW